MFLSRNAVKVQLGRGAKQNQRNNAPVQTRAASTDAKKSFNKILIANRGEIACRVMKTAKKMGIKTVAVYSDADTYALHTRTADEAVYLGPSPSDQSYLQMDKIVAACKEIGADAVHPGYGFLSENNEFVAKLEKNGITFIGPDSHAIDVMGDKIHSKKLAKDAGVNVIPGFLGEVRDENHCLEIAQEIGYPVMVKASAGGGGKGMRVAWNDEEAREAFRLSKQEALKSFGDDAMLVEKFIDEPRHIEVQVLCDGVDKYLYLPERECSIQRRNQKVIEEAPSPFIDPETRRKMGEQAVMLARAVKYKTAGTVEFLVDSKKNFYFLEMNTRLQVEHPITEEITGLDLVEHMINIAAGNGLNLEQERAAQINGWAIESRVYAENPLRNFLPSIGRLRYYNEPYPLSTEGLVRLDTGIVEGSEISVYYDPLICKLSVWDKTRAGAIELMKGALDTYVIHGVNHNICFLRDVMDNTKFHEGKITTNFIPEEYPEGFTGHALTPTERHNLVSAAVVVKTLQTYIKPDQAIEPSPLSWQVQIGDDEAVNVKVSPTKLHSTQHLAVEFENGTTLEVDLTKYKPLARIMDVMINGERVLIQYYHTKGLSYTFQYVGSLYDVQVLSPAEAKYIDHMPEPVKIDFNKYVISPMAGTLISVAVKPGDKVAQGQEIAVVEAMKMQNLLRAERNGVVKAVKATPGSSVQLEEIIIEFED